MSKIEELNSYIQKAKVYVKSPEDVPEGATVETGEKGGHYYESGGRVEAKTEEPAEEKPQQHKTVLSDKQIDSVLRELSSGIPYETGKTLYEKAATQLYKEYGFTDKDISLLSKFYEEDKYTESNVLQPATFFSQVFWAEKLGYNVRNVFARLSKFYVDSDSYNQYKTINEMTGDVKESYDENIGARLEVGKRVIESLFDSKKVVVYRGCSKGKIGKRVSGGRVEFNSTFPVSRWTLDPGVAKDFAEKKDGFIIRAEITADRILQMDYVTGNSSFAYECEVDIDHRGIEGKIFLAREEVSELRKGIQIIEITSDQNWIADIRKKDIKKSSDNSLKAQIDFTSKLTGINHFIVTGLDDSFSKNAQDKLNAYTKENNIQIAIELATDGQELVVDRIKLLKDIKKAEDNIFGIFTPPKIRMPFFEDNFNAKDLWDRWGRDKLSRGSKISIEPKYDGFRAILTKKAGIIRLWLVESQQDRAIILGDLIEKLLTIPFDFAIDGVLKADIDILNDNFQSTSTYEYIMFDALCLDSDITDYSQEYRRGKLEELYKSNFVDIKKFSLGRAKIAENRAEFFSAVEKLLSAGRSVIAKDTSGRYTFGETDNVNRIRKKAEVKVMVLDKEMGEDGKWIYTCGVLS